MTPFVYDPDRDDRWKAAMAAAIEAAHSNPALDMQPILYPTTPYDVAVRWFARDGSANGELHWRSFEPESGIRFDPVRFFDGAPEELQIARGLYHFEDHPDGGDGTMVLATADGRLFAHYSGEQALLPMTVDVATYIEIQISVLGLHGVIEAFTDCTAHGRSSEGPSAIHARYLQRIRSTPRDILAVARQLFADRDHTALESVAND